MLINKCEESEELHVKFVSYTGKWPCLCCGVLTLNINGKDCVFGYCDNAIGSKFWISGGDCNMKRITEDEWIIDYNKIPDEFKQFAEEIDRVFNANIEYGCCGGCR